MDAVVVACLLRSISGARRSRHTARVQALFRVSFRVAFLIFGDEGQSELRQATQALINRYAKSNT
jgi:hypothetical protein